MPAKKKKFHGGRALLNLEGQESTAAMVAEVEDTSSWKKGKGYDGSELKHRWEATPSILLQFANCDRSIAFTGSIDTPENIENTFYKVDTMIELLQKFRAGIAIEAARYADRVAGLDDDD